MDLTCSGKIVQPPAAGENDSTNIAMVVRQSGQLIFILFHVKTSLA